MAQGVNRATDLGALPDDPIGSRDWQSVVAREDRFINCVLRLRVVEGLTQSHWLP